MSGKTICWLHLDDVRFYRSQRRADDCQLLANCGYNSRNVTIASLALSIGIGFYSDTGNF